MDKTEETQSDPPTESTQHTQSGSVLNAQLIDPGALLSQTFDIYKKLWKQLLLFTFFPYLSLLPFLLLVLLFIVTGYLSFSSHNYVLVILLAAIGIIIAFVYLSITFSIGQVAMIYTITERGSNSVEDSLKKGWRIMWSFWSTQFLSSIIISGGILLFMIPGTIFSTWFIFCQYVLLTEGLSGMDALVRSREYVRGRFWGVLGRIFLISLLLSLVTSAPIYILGVTRYWEIGFTLRGVLIIILSPLSTIYFVLLYENAKKLTPTVPPPSANAKLLYIFLAILGFAVFIGFIFFIISVILPPLIHSLQQQPLPLPQTPYV